MVGVVYEGDVVLALFLLRVGGDNRCFAIARGLYLLVDVASRIGQSSNSANTFQLTKK